MDIEYPQSIRFRFALRLKPWLLLGFRRSGGQLWEVYSNKRGYAVSHKPDGDGRKYVLYFYPKPEDGLDCWLSRGAIVNKYIQAVKARSKKGRKGEVSGDPYLCEGRPALTAFLCETGESEKDVRDLSALMIVHGDDGVRVGLRDDDCGGWLWRSGKTLADGLNAIEKALQDGTATFGGSKERRAKKGR
jgi:hypothetical protein